jgi:hypothetical protein
MKKVSFVFVFIFFLTSIIVSQNVIDLSVGDQIIIPLKITNSVTIGRCACDFSDKRGRMCNLYVFEKIKNNTLFDTTWYHRMYKHKSKYIIDNNIFFRDSIIHKNFPNSNMILFRTPNQVVIDSAMIAIVSISPYGYLCCEKIIPYSNTIVVTDNSSNWGYIAEFLPCTKKRWVNRVIQKAFGISTGKRHVIPKEKIYFWREMNAYLQQNK